MMQRVTQVLPCNLEHEAWQRQHPPAKLTQRRAQKELGCQFRVFSVVDEEPVHLRRRNAVGEPGSHEAARRHADINVERVEIDALERVREGEQHPDLVDAAQRAATG